MMRLRRWLCAHGIHRIEHVRNVSVHWSEGRCTRCPWQGILRGLARDAMICENCGKEAEMLQPCPCCGRLQVCPRCTRQVRLNLQRVGREG